MKILVVGAGFAGSVLARELAEQGGHDVTLIDKREHIGGNAFDPVHPQTGARYHRYGPHIFHTNSREIYDYLSRFTQWLPYQHRVQVILPCGLSAPMPVNLDTLNLHYGLSLTDEQGMRDFLESVREPISSPENAEEHLYATYGREITDLFFGRYTLKMWGLQLREMPVSLVARLPVRYDTQSDYFDDAFQCMPAQGYEQLFNNMLAHEGITVRTSVAFEKSMERDFDYVFNSMPIDEYFELEFGPLPYRSIQFHHRFDERFDHTVPTVNFTDEGEFTRKTSWALYPGCGGEPGQHVTYEVPCSYEENALERYYPIKTVDGWPQARYRQYAELAKQHNAMTFIGRCGQYVYYDMHQVVANSLKIARDFLAE